VTNRVFSAGSTFQGTDGLAYSVYVGRDLLGRFVCLGPKQYEAFNCMDESIGIFVKEKDAIAAIWAAADKNR
jgi:hypothetical protein